MGGGSLPSHCLQRPCRSVWLVHGPVTSHRFSRALATSAVPERTVLSVEPVDHVPVTIVLADEAGT